MQYDDGRFAEHPGEYIVDHECRSGDVGPAAREAMGESCVSCMWLGGSYFG